MGLTINQLIYNLRNLYRDAKSDDIKLSDRQIEFIINYLRADLIAQDYNKGRSLSSNVKQDLGKVQLAKIDTSEETSLPSGTFILKSVLKLPKTLEFNNKDAITYVGGIDKMSPMQFSTKAATTWSRHSKYASKNILPFIKEGYLYLHNCTNLLKWINVEGVFENPRDVAKFKQVNGLPVYNPDIDDYPISGKMIRVINQLFLTGELALFLQLTEDIRNDASDVIRTGQPK